MEQKPKTVFQLDLPFTSTPWPQLSEESQDTILELLCNALSPIGRHREHHIVPSKGKRSKKRKRQEAKVKDRIRAVSPPAAPEISSFLVVGLRSITRMLELSSQKSKPPKLSSATDSEIIDDISSSPDNATTKGAQQNSITKLTQSHLTPPIQGHFSAIFVLRSSQPAILHSHLPQLVATSSLAYPELQPTKLVQLPKGCDARICAALGLQRVSFIGILEGTPQAKALLDAVREKVPDIEVSWLKEVSSQIYRPLNIKAIETFQSTVKKTTKGS